MSKYSARNISSNFTADIKQAANVLCVHRFFVYLSAVKTISFLLTKGILYAIIAFVLNRTIV